MMHAILVTNIYTANIVAFIVYSAHAAFVDILMSEMPHGQSTRLMKSFWPRYLGVMTVKGYGNYHVGNIKGKHRHVSSNRRKIQFYWMLFFADRVVTFNVVLYLNQRPHKFYVQIFSMLC